MRSIVALIALLFVVGCDSPIESKPLPVIGWSSVVRVGQDTTGNDLYVWVIGYHAEPGRSLHVCQVRSANEAGRAHGSRVPCNYRLVDRPLGEMEWDMSWATS